MPITDAFGVWGYLGSVTPNGDWIKFPLVAADVNPTVRLTFACSDFSKIVSSAWFRTVFEVSGSKVVQPSIRVYPKPEILLLQMPIPNDFVERGVTIRSFEIKKRFPYLKRVGLTIDIEWSVHLEELWG